jgi:hypothetical protein
VGEVELQFSPPTDEITVTYTIKEGFSVDGIHIYVGVDQVPSKNGSPTVAPGQFSCTTTSQENCVISEGIDSIVVTLTNVPSEFYIIAHADVSGPSSLFTSNRRVCPI